MTDKYNDYDSFEKHMETTYPKMFSGNYGGFAIGKGWWKIIDKLCWEIQNHVDWKQQQKEKYGRGDGCEQVVVVQVKEKFGGLRFYTEGGDEQIYGMIRMAEIWANSVCEECGDPAIIRTGGWIRNLCDTHEAERQQRIQEKVSQDD